MDDGSDFLTEWRSSKEWVTAHTSGTTGVPKEIRLLKRDMIASAEATCAFFGIDSRSVLLSPLSTDYIAGKMMVVRAEISGATLIQETPSMRPLSQDYGCDIDLLPVVPAQLAALLDNPMLARVRNLLVGGGAIDPVMEDRLRDLDGVKVYVSYGMTETCSHIALRDVTAGHDYYVTLPGITVESDDRGCLVARLPHFSIGEVVTNDVVEILDECRFRWLGRVDNVINSGGIKLHPEIIERRLAGIVDADFFVTGRPSERWGEELVMYVEGECDAEDVIEKARLRVDRFSVPKEVICVRRFDRTNSGKVIRRLY